MCYVNDIYHGWRTPYFHQLNTKLSDSFKIKNDEDDEVR